MTNVGNMNIAEQSPATKNQINNERPSIKRTRNILQGMNFGSMNGGLIRPVGWKKVLAGEKNYAYKRHIYIKMLTPLTPNYQKLKMVLKAYFVPDTRVWENAKKFYAQKGGATITKLTTKPNIGFGTGYSIPWINCGQQQGQTGYDFINYLDTELYRDSWVSGYMPRVESGTNYRGAVAPTTGIKAPPIDACLLRGFKAIYNDFERNKEYDTVWTEYKGDTVGSQEFSSYFTNIVNSNNAGMLSAEIMESFAPRGKRQNSYYTDYRSEKGDTTTAGTQPAGSADVFTFEDWLKKIAVARENAENAQKNDWDIIAEMGGTRKATQGEVVLLGTKEIGLNFIPVTQNTYNNASGVDDQFQLMGTQGAYSFSDAEVELFGNYEFIENGYIHIIAQVTTDTIFETGIDRNLLNINNNDQYRPEYESLIDDVLYLAETDTIRKDYQAQTDYTTIIGWKRKYNELFKLPNIVQGDFTKTQFYGLNKTSKMIDYTKKLLTQKSYAYIENEAKKDDKKYWKDYTDMYINDNQAIKQDEIIYGTLGGTYKEPRVIGQNQIFFVAVDTAIVELPVSNEIANNYTRWNQK